jgi:hypothetical protein
VLVALLHGLCAVPGVVTHRSFMYDEVIYVSQFGTGLHPLTMTAPRAWGLPLLLAPVDMLTTSVPTIRLALAALSVGGLYLAFRAWLGVAERWVAPVAALLFASLWATTTYASMAFPNLWLAYASVAGIGLALGVGRGTPSRRLLAGVAVAFAAASLIRPSDSLLLAAPVLVLAVLRRQRSLSLALLAGLAVGGAAWLAEAFVRFGGPIERLREVARITGAGASFEPWHLLTSADGPDLYCRPAAVCGPLDPVAVVWLVALPFLAALGIWVARERVPLVVATTSAILLLPQYAVGVDWSNPRYLLPVYALLVLPVATLAVRTAARGPFAAGVVVLVFVAHAVIQLATYQRVDSEMIATARRTQVTVREVRRAGVRPPCVVFPRSAIAVAYQMRCRGIDVLGDTPDPASPDVAAALAAGERVVLVYVRSERPADLPGWVVTGVRSLPDRWLRVSQPAASGAPADAPP